jgi:type 1 glutamine amidotransferase
MNIFLKTKHIFSSLTLGIISCCCVLSFLLVSFQKNNDKGTFAKEKKVLIFSKTNGYRHESIPEGINAIKKMGLENHFSVTTTEDSLDINVKNLNQYQAIIFLNTTGDLLGQKQKEALQNFIHKGRGFVGVHAATDCEYKLPWYIKMVGASFISHPSPQTAKLEVINNKHLSTKHLPTIWERKDEWYNFTDINPEVNVLIKIDEHSYTGGKNNNNHPIAWYHNYEGGRVFYTALGHTTESYSEPVFLQHLLGGIIYAMGTK